MSFGISTLILFVQLIFLVFGCGKKKQAPTVKPATPKNENRSSVAGPPPPDDAAAKAKEEEEKKKKEEEEKKKKEEEEAEKKKKEEEEEKKKKEEEEKKKKEEEEEKKKKEEEEKKEKEKKEEEEKKKKEEEEAEKKKEEETKKNESQRNAGKPHLTLEPSGDLVFKAESIAQTRMEFKNVHTKKIMFKIKFSDNAYQANPVFGTIEPGKTAEVWITHNKSPHKEAKMVIVNSNYVGDMDLAKSFRSVRPTGGQVTVKLIAN